MAGEPVSLPRRHWLRWLVLAAFLAAVLLGATLAGLAGTVLDLSRGTPALASLLQRVPAQTTVIFDSHGRPIAQLHGAVNRVIVPSSRLPLVLKEATVAVEDKRFYSDFHGVDLRASCGRRWPTSGGPCGAGRQHDHRAVRQERLPGWL